MGNRELTEKYVNKYMQFTSSQCIIEVDPIDELDVTIKDLHKSTHDCFPDDIEVLVEAEKYVFKSKSSKLLIDDHRLALHVDYFGNYVTDYNLCHNYLENKMRSVFRGIQTVTDKSVRFLALLTKSQISFSGLDDEPIPFLLNRFLPGSRQNSIEDFALRVGLNKDDKYYVNYTTSSYLSRSFDPPVKFPPGNALRVKLHELKLVDAGITIIVDINTKRDAYQRLPDYKEQDLTDFLHVSKKMITPGVLEYLSQGL